VLITSSFFFVFRDPSLDAGVSIFPSPSQWSLPAFVISEMSQSLLFRTIQAVVMACICQWIKKLLTYSIVMLSSLSPVLLRAVLGLPHLTSFTIGHPWTAIVQYEVCSILNTPPIPSPSRETVAYNISFTVEWHCSKSIVVLAGMMTLTASGNQQWSVSYTTTSHVYWSQSRKIVDLTSRCGKMSSDYLSMHYQANVNCHRP